MTINTCPKCGSEHIILRSLLGEGAVVECSRCHTAVVRHVGTLTDAIAAWDKLPPDRRCAVCANRGETCSVCIGHGCYVCGE